MKPRRRSARRMIRRPTTNIRPRVRSALAAKRSFGTCVPKQSLGTRETSVATRGRWRPSAYLSFLPRVDLLDRQIVGGEEGAELFAGDAAEVGENLVLILSL